MPTADLSNLTASQYTVSASVSDKAGNPATATHGLAVDLTVPVLTINTVSGDDIINAAEHGQGAGDLRLQHWRGKRAMSSPSR
ncbi:hypothetical protein HT118_19335 [Escherichia coli]|nr:hypothetical protein [Escherichia coli]